MAVASLATTIHHPGCPTAVETHISTQMLHATQNSNCPNPQRPHATVQATMIPLGRSTLANNGAPNPVSLENSDLNALSSLIALTTLESLSICGLRNSANLEFNADA